MSKIAVSLFVRLWVEICRYQYVFPVVDRQPLREAVSWNIKDVRDKLESCCQPLREAVSWNSGVVARSTFVRSQPLREAVSWNNPGDVWATWTYVSLFVRLWVEIRKRLTMTINGQVSLFVRLWVEIKKTGSRFPWPMVSLFVRLWVEISERAGFSAGNSSASSWGCELKYLLSGFLEIA